MTVYSAGLVDPRRPERGHEVIAERVHTHNGPLIASAPEQQVKIDALADALEALLDDDVYLGDKHRERVRAALRAAGRLP